MTCLLMPLRTLALLQAELLLKAAALAADIHGVKKMRCISMRWNSRRVITGVAAGIALQRLYSGELTTTHFINHTCEMVMQP